MWQSRIIIERRAMAYVLKGVSRPQIEVEDSNTHRTRLVFHDAGGIESVDVQGDEVVVVDKREGRVSVYDAATGPFKDVWLSQARPVGGFAACPTRPRRVSRARGDRTRAPAPWSSAPFSLRPRTASMSQALP